MANNFIVRITDAAEKVILSRVKNTNLLNEYYNRSDKRASYKRQAVNFEKKEIKDWKLALMSFTDPENPRRGLLMRFYESLKLDLHLGSCIDQRILPIQCAKFKLVNEKGDEDIEAHKLLDKPWFLELIRYVVGSTFQGTTLIELFEVNEKGEVKEVSEIPQSNFLAHKGIIINEEFDDNGTSYKEGLYKNYYIQIGSNNSLGLLNQLSMIILAKKLGLGSWMSYIEKFGIPPVFITTDRVDRTRIDELFEMLTNFKSAFFAVLQGNEKVETQTNAGVDGYQSFKALHEVCDNALSKRLLGGTGTTDEKSFVGSSEVHERQLLMRNKVDKLLFKFYFNEEIKPRLVGLSSVYAPLEKLTFDFDDKETLTLKETIELIKSLSQYYDFDIDELVKITGLPITAVKAAMGIAPPEPDPQKKKPSANIKGLAPHAKITPDFVIFAATWDAAIERLANQIYTGEVKPTDLDKDLVLKNYAALNKKAETTWGEGYYDEAITRRFRENLMNFASAKSYKLMNELSELKDKSQSKDQFINEAKKAVNLHNNTYLEAETNFVANAVIGARNFNDHFKDEDILPNLKYKTLNDDRVRDDHQKLDGIIKPLRDPFWNIYYPPNGWRCRCFIQQTDEEATSTVPNVDLPEEFRNNTARTGEVFNHKNNYRKNIAEKDWKKVHTNGQGYKEYSPYNKVLEVDEKKIFVSDFADYSDINSNIGAAKKIVRHLKIDIYIKPNLNTNSSIKNPEYGFKKQSSLADLKTYDPKKSKSTRSFVKNSVDSASDQKVETVALDLSQTTEADYLEKCAAKLHGEFNNDGKPTIKQVIIIHGDKVLSVKRQDIIKKNYLDFFKFD